MPKFSLLSPLDQPLGHRRFLEDLKKLLANPDFDQFGFSVAFAKIGPFFRLADSFQSWRKSGKKIRGIFGIDHNGTSVQALEFALENFDEVYLTQYPGYSFHPKIYWFRGPHKACAIVGSNNFTVGGTELNFESAIYLDFDLTFESESFKSITDMFESLLPIHCTATRVLTREILFDLVSENLLLDETKKKTDRIKVVVAKSFKNAPKLPVRPASSIPSSILAKTATRKEVLQKKAEVIKTQATVIDITQPLVPVAGLAIQIKPHKNGEIFLSRTAAKQNPAFFGMPFTGMTQPKKGKNQGYPQREPDPVCNIMVFGKDNQVIYSCEKYSLNTVFYDKKSEIRITAAALVNHVPDYSVLVIMPGQEVGVDYEMQIFIPEGPDYSKWLEICNQEMPSGGKELRRFGWF